MHHQTSSSSTPDWRNYNMFNYHQQQTSLSYGGNATSVAAASSYHHHHHQDGSPRSSDYQQALFDTNYALAQVHQHIPQHHQAAAAGCRVHDNDEADGKEQCGGTAKEPTITTKASQQQNWQQKVLTAVDWGGTNEHCSNFSSGNEAFGQASSSSIPYSAATTGDLMMAKTNYWT